MSIDMAQFHQVFFEESFEGLDIMESGLLDMDPGAVDSEQINAIFRAAHSIKGGAGTFGFSDISGFTHTMETLLDEMRDGRREITTDAVDVLLKSVDVLRDMLTAAQDGGEVDQANVDTQSAELKRVLDSRPGQEAPTAGGDGDGEKATVAEAAAAPVIGWHVVFRPHAHLMRTGNDPLRLLKEFRDLGETSVSCDIGGIPEFHEYEPEDACLSWDIHLREAVDKYQVQEIFDWVEDDCDLAIMEIYDESAPSAPGPAPVESAPTEPAPGSQAKPDLKLADPPPERRGGADRRKPAKPAANSSAGSIRVDVPKIDSLINMVGELVITQSMLSMLGEDFDMQDVPKLLEGLAQLERHTRELQESVMQVRMMPISFTFSRFPRLVRDLSSKLNKKIELKMIGESTEVDKTVIEKIGDPLVHLVRNSLDHGIELPEVRVAAGKPETGTVVLNAYHKGGNIVIEIKDDGKGLDGDFLFDKAVGKGLLKPDEVLTDKQKYELIFMAGFSTAEQISDVSGRGVGMDVVRKNINELGGSIEIESELGVGTSIIIRLPLTLAILDGQVVRVGDETYIVPLVSIIESIQVRPEMINLVGGKGEAFKLRDEYLPIVRMHEVFDVSTEHVEELTEGLLVIVEAEGRKCGLFVDDLLGQHQVVIKSLEENYGNVEGVSGATILGDGSVALILDITGVIRLSGSRPDDFRLPRSA